MYRRDSGKLKERNRTLTVLSEDGREGVDLGVDGRTRLLLVSEEPEEGTAKRARGRPKKNA